MDGIQVVSRFKLSEKAQNFLEKKGYHLVCHYCGAPLKAGEMIVSRPIYSVNKKAENKKYWHQQCWDVECRVL